MVCWNAKAVSMAIVFLTTHNGFAQEYTQPLSYPRTIIQQPQQTSSSLLTLHNKRVLDELDLAQSQRQELLMIWHGNQQSRHEKRMAVLKRFSKSVAPIHPNAGSGPIPIDTSSPVAQLALNDVETEYDKLYMAKIDEVFLPHQRKRFLELQARTEFNAVLNGDTRLSLLVESLNITDDQLDEIKKTAPEFNEKLEQEIAQLREKRHREYLQSILTRNQMKNLKKLLGDPLKPFEANTKSSDNK